MSLCRGVDGGRWDRCSFGKPRRAEAKRFRENTPTTPMLSLGCFAVALSHVLFLYY